MSGIRGTLPRRLQPFSSPDATQKKQALPTKAKPVEAKSVSQPAPVKVSDKVKTGVGSQPASDASKPSQSKIRQQVKQLMTKIRKRRPAQPAKVKAKKLAQKDNRYKSASTSLRNSTQGFYPGKTAWVKSKDSTYDANKITYQNGEYIAGVTPEEPYNPLNIKGETQQFWERVLDEESVVIIDLTCSGEEERLCYPIEGECFKVGECELLFLSEMCHLGYKKIFIKMTLPEGASRLITWLHYYSWPEKGVPKGAQRKQFIRFVKSTMGLSDAPMTVVCHSDKGKVGTFIVMQQLFEYLSKGMLTPEGLMDSLDYLVSTGRDASDESFVETEGQFMLLLESGYSMIEWMAFMQQGEDSKENMKYLDDLI